MRWRCKSGCALLLATAIGIAGCAPAPFVKNDDGTYTISQKSAGGIYKSVSDIKMEVMVRVNEFAESQNSVAVPVAEKGRPANLTPGRMPMYTYTFRLVPKGIGKATSGGASGAPPSDDAVYQKLLQLEDLRARGILTQAEFEAEKAKILGGR